MSDLKPFVHGEEGTHYCCNARIKAEGGKALCCECNPHEGCELNESGAGAKQANAEGVK